MSRASITSVFSFAVLLASAGASLPLLGCNQSGTCVQMNAVDAVGKKPAQDTCITNVPKVGCGAPNSTYYPESGEEGAGRCTTTGFTLGAAAGPGGGAAVYSRDHK